MAPISILFALTATPQHGVPTYETYPPRALEPASGTLENAFDTLTQC